ncbi:acetyl-CoA carboxylase [Nesterenkonia marinintestina]|uniref:acetyl-CoA carboxylase n=1 Tax=Nesterenkonia marinintestina TaxID=2979865 RepID=UPI0021BEC93C|nr:acetyl-CoA carboxylase [Nesterenkonia sp. GX14115]
MAEVISPLPGTFYAAPAPDEDPYVNEGDDVEAGQVIGLVEVMKQFSEIKSQVAGTVSSIEVANGDAVTPGTVVAVIEEK